MTDEHSRADEQFEALIETDLGDWTPVVVYASLGKNDDVPTYQQLSMSSDLGGLFTDISQKTLNDLCSSREANDMELLEYTESANPQAHQTEYLDMSEIGFLKDQLTHLDDVSEIPLFEAEEEFLKGLRFYGIIMQSPGSDDPILLFRKYSQAYQLGKNRWTMRWSQEHFDLVSEPSYLVDSRIDCIAQGDFMFVLRKDGFKKIFRFYEMLEQEADKALHEIRQNISIKNGAEFEEVCKSHPYRLGLLRDISQQPYLSELTPLVLQQAIDETKAPVEMDGDELVFDSSKPWAILHLLNDAYFKSPMTGEYYRADSKKRRQV